MPENRPRVLLACNNEIRYNHVADQDLRRLEAFADWDWFPCSGGGIYDTNTDPNAALLFSKKLPGHDALVVCLGAPTLTADMLDAAPTLRFVGEMEGDRFASRIDLNAAWDRGIRTVDTTNASSYPVSEWALAMILVCLRNGGAHFRRMIAGQTSHDRSVVKGMPGVLWGRRVGLIGCGHMGRRLMKFLRAFETEIWVHDPYLPREMPEALGFLQTSLENVLSCDVVVCLVPHTPATEGMLGKEELARLRPGSVFVSVSRGKVTDSAALIERLKQGDIVVGLDVFDPEPVPPDSEILQLPNVFLSPHIGAYGGPTGQLGFFSLMVDELERFFNGHETQFDLTPRVQANRTGAEP
jgi:phosphoglycerate dehydrogenase-like enzyme